jgi:hypothetical protein
MLVPPKTYLQLVPTNVKDVADRSSRILFDQSTIDVSSF